MYIKPGQNISTEHLILPQTIPFVFSLSRCWHISKKLHSVDVFVVVECARWLTMKNKIIKINNSLVHVRKQKSNIYIAGKYSQLIFSMNWIVIKHPNIIPLQYKLFSKCLSSDMLYDTGWNLKNTHRRNFLLTAILKKKSSNKMKLTILPRLKLLL